MMLESISSNGGRDATHKAHEELILAYQTINKELFAGKLPACVITLQRGKKRVRGYYSHKRLSGVKSGIIDEIGMNPCYFGVRTQVEVLSTLCHEAVHAWQRHYGKPSRNGYHNKEWADKMLEVGLHPSNTGKPGGKKTGEAMTHYILTEGPFIEMARRLFASGFQFTYYDRYVSFDQVFNDTHQGEYGLPGMGDIVASDIGGGIVTLDVVDAVSLEDIDEYEGRLELIGLSGVGATAVPGAEGTNCNAHSNSNGVLATDDGHIHLSAASPDETVVAQGGEDGSSTLPPDAGGGMSDHPDLPEPPEGMVVAPSSGVPTTVIARRLDSSSKIKEAIAAGKVRKIERTELIKKSGNGIRIKYGCTCGIRVWGRSGLSIRCNQCMGDMVELP